ncbi:NUDIX hydrolase domain-like protein [Xylaria sp. FL0043]|nr:NUDIX hydrolase domain-like protein [Xylaria sp. FL0043]
MGRKILYHPSAAHFEVSKRAYLDAHPNMSFGEISASVLAIDTTDIHNPRILLLQHAANASDPNKWEPPRDACKDDDQTILHAVGRALLVQAGLGIGFIGGSVGDPRISTLDDGKKVCQLNFAVVARAADAAPLVMRPHPEDPRGAIWAGEHTELVVKLGSEKHQRSVWATEDEVKAKKVRDTVLDFTSEEVERTVLLTFQYIRDNWNLECMVKDVEIQASMG